MLPAHTQEVVRGAEGSNQGSCVGYLRIKNLDAVHDLSATWQLAFSEAESEVVTPLPHQISANVIVGAKKGCSASVSASVRDRGCREVRSTVQLGSAESRTCAY